MSTNAPEVVNAAFEATSIVLAIDEVVDQISVLDQHISDIFAFTVVCPNRNRLELSQPAVDVKVLSWIQEVNEACLPCNHQDDFDDNDELRCKA